MGGTTALLKDFLHAFRTLRRSPAFAVTAALTIALGIGASTAIFSVGNAVLLRPLPYKDPGRLVLGLFDMTRRGVRDQLFSAADFFDLRNGMQSVFDGVAGIYTYPQVMPRRDGNPEFVRIGLVTPNFFKVMGGRIAAGRDFEESDGLPEPPPPPAGAAAAPSLPPMLIFSYGYWQRRFGGDTSIFGHPMGANSAATPVGVLAPGFELLFAPKLHMEQVPDVWLAGRFAYDNTQRNSHIIRPVARLRPGITMERAQAEADRVSVELQKNFLITQTAGGRVRLEQMGEHLTAEVRPALVAVTGAVMILLLISCSNVANLLLVRTGLREREMVVRTALGASRWSLMRSVLCEALLLAAAGGAFGVGLGWAGIRELRAIAPANLPRLNEVAIDWTVLGFTALAALVSAVLFGMVPAWRGARPDIAGVLRAGGRNPGFRGPGLLRDGVVIVEVALSFVLLTGSGLMLRSFLALGRIDPGFDPSGLLTFRVLGVRAGMAPEARAAFMREMQTGLSAIPGVESAAPSYPFPLAEGATPTRWGLAASLADPTRFQAADWQIVLPGYFETMRTRLLAGRTFTAADNAPDRAVAIVDETLAAKAYPNESAVGKRILIRLRPKEPEWVEIVGVVRHQRPTALAEQGREQVYVTDGYLSLGTVQRWAVRTAKSPERFAVEVREAIGRIDSRLVLTEVQPMTALVERSEAGTRFSLMLIAVFAAIAAVLAAVGLYGVLASVVRQRTAEIGVRMALGAEPGLVFRSMIGYGLRLSAAGVGAGLVASLALTRVMNSMLVGIKATDPLTFAAAVAMFLVIAAIACGVPARRAAALDPNEALRQE
jgi:putative ABC transport system permease protein